MYYLAQAALLANFALSCLTPVLEPFLIERVRTLYWPEHLPACAIYDLLQFNMDPVNISLVFIIPSVTFGVSNIIAGVIADKLVSCALHMIKSQNGS